MSLGAQISGEKDSILSCQKAIDSGRQVKYMITARPKKRHSCLFHSANLNVVPVIARVAAARRTSLAREDGKDEDTLTASFYSRLITFSIPEILTSYDPHGRVPGGFA